MTNAQQAHVETITGARPDVTFAVAEDGNGKVLMKGTSKREDGLAWPTIVIGKGAGIDLLEVRSWSTDKYPKPIEAALVADVLYANQLGRALKAAQATKPVEKTGELSGPGAEVGDLTEVLKASLSKARGNGAGKQFTTGEKELTEDEQLEQMIAEEEAAQKA